MAVPRVALFGALAACLLAGASIIRLPPHPFFSAVMPPLAILGFAAPGYAAFVRLAGWRRGLLVLAGLGLFAIGIEALSITSGFPYGEFVYGPQIGWRIGGLVPWTVPFAWVPLALGAYAVATRIATERYRPLAVTVLGAALLVLIDFCLDPIAVRLGYWTYTYPGPYFQVPWQNFLGWFLSGSLACAVIGWAAGWKSLPRSAWLGLAAILLFWIGACVSSELLVPALAGGVALTLVWPWPKMDNSRAF